MPALAAGTLSLLSVLMAAAALAQRVDSRVLARLGPVAGDAEQGRDRRSPARELVQRIGSSRRFARPPSEKLASRLAASGSTWAVEELAGAKTIGAAAGLGLGLLLPAPGLLVSPLLAFVGYRLPDLMLARKVAGRRREADAELPQLLDLLAAASTAGLSVPLALDRAVASLHGPLAEELESAVRAVTLGRRWRDELRAMAERMRLADLRRAVAALTRSESLGTSLADAMTRFASEVRSARRAAASERARKAPVKMLFPLVFMILPAFLLLTVVPVLLSTLRSIR